MKFSSSLKFNAVAEWWDEYIAYSALKKYIFQLEKQYHDSTTLGGAAATDLEATDERTSLLLRTTTTNLLHHNNRDEDEHGNSAQFVNNRDSRHLRALQSADKIFSGLLDKELEKIVRFYRTIEADLHRDMVALESDVAMKDAQGASPTNSGFFDEDDEEDEEDEEDGKGRSASGVRRQRTASPSDVRYSISDYYGELGGLSPTSAANPHGNPLTRGISATSAAGGASTSRRRNRMPSDAAATQSKSTLANLFDKVVPRRRSVSGGGGVTDLLIPPASSTGGPYNVWNAKSTYARDVRMLFKRRITNLYNTAVGLRAYAELNFSGFRKILKKYDKVLESDLQRPYLQDKVEKAYPWLPETKAKLEGWITTLHNFYAKCVTHGDQVAAEKQLQLYQREQVVWERDT
ncbi:low-affinity phosphate transporter, partial [Serendipita sp. 399]